jgi:5,10-methylenetetrahydromethanopterin reductase
MREYLSVLLPLLDGMPVSVDGSTLSAHIGLSTPRAGRVPVLLAAMAPRMLNLAGEQTDGTVLADAGVTDFVAAEFARAEDREKDPQPAEGSHRRKLAPAPLAGRHAAAGPGLISSAAASRTCSRRARSRAVCPPPSGYLMIPA